jgi:hypothetical protein
MNPSQSSIGTALAAWCALLNGGSAVALSGTRPANVSTALAGNTALCTAVFNNPAFGAPAYNAGDVAMEAVASFSAASFAPAANGACTFVRVYKSDGVTAVADLSVGSDHIASNQTAVGQYCSNAGNTYRASAVAGDAKTGAASPPVGVGNGIVDGNVTWDYVGAGQLYEFKLGNCNLLVGVPDDWSYTATQPVPNAV